jgi:hypothetical protein
LDFYDVAAHECLVDPMMEKRLGFKRILISNSDLKIENVDQKVGKFGVSIAFGSDKKRLYEHARNGTKGLAILDSGIDLKLLGAMAENETILCIPMAPMTTARNYEVSRTIYRNTKLIEKAKKYKIKISLISMAPTSTYLCSSIQLIELGKMMGLDDKYARYSVSTVNGELWD